MVVFASNVTGIFRLFTLDRNALLPIGDYQATCLTCGHPVGLVQAADPVRAPGLP